MILHAGRRVWRDGFQPQQHALSDFNTSRSLRLHFTTGLPVSEYGGRTTGKRGLQRRVQWSGSWVWDIAILVYDKWGDGVILRDTLHFSIFPSGTEVTYEKSEIEVD